MIHVRQHILTMLAPYLTADCVPPSESNISSTSTAWLAPAIDLCSSTYTSRLPTSRFTPQEHLLKASIEQTTHEICRTIGVIWTTAFSAESVPAASLPPLLAGWKQEVQRLRKWLGWALWEKCNPACAEDEICTVPQWPFDGVWSGTEDTTPHCLSRLHWGGRRR